MAQGTLGKFISKRLGVQNFNERPEPYLWLGWFVTGTPATTTAIGLGLGTTIFGGLTMPFFGALAGMAAGSFIVISALEKHFLIRNSSAGVFVTKDIIKSARGLPEDQFHFVYGPGLHVALPWEDRDAYNNISIEEAASELTIVVQCADGTLTGKGSFRLRADPRMYDPSLPNDQRARIALRFLRGVASIASEIEDLVKLYAVEHLSTMTVSQALGNLATLNQALKDALTEGDGRAQMVSALEQRFGIEITDATISQLLPSTDQQRTMSALGEAAAIAKGTAIMLGMTEEEAKAALVAGRLLRKDYNEARDRFMAASGNLEGVEVKRFEVDLRGDESLTQALGDLVKSPAGQAIAAGLAQKSAPAAGAKNNRNNRRRNKKPQPTQSKE